MRRFFESWEVIIGLLNINFTLIIALTISFVTFCKLPFYSIASESKAEAISNTDSLQSSGSEDVSRELAEIPAPLEISAKDLPNDTGNSIVITWRRVENLPEDVAFTLYFAQSIEGPFRPLPFDFSPVRADENLMSENLQYFPYRRENENYQYIIVDLTSFPTSPKQEYNLNSLYFKLGVIKNGEVRLFDPPLTAKPKENFFDTSKVNTLVMAVLFIVLLLILIETAKRKDLYLRRIAGLDAIDEAIGRATEMGRPILYLCGLDPMTTVSTIAATNILGHVAKHVAKFESRVKVPCFDPIVMSVCQEVVREAFYNAGRPDQHDPNDIFFLTNDQFSYVAAVNGIMAREKPAANFYFGYYYAESLLLGEVGQSTGAIQIAGTDSNVQIPFFITSCDYTLIGEELYAASAYISREPKLLGSIKASDMAKAFILVVLTLGLLFSLVLIALKPVNPENTMGRVGEAMEYYMEMFNEHA